jgi:hypothetical protein
MKQKIILIIILIIVIFCLLSSRKEEFTNLKGSVLIIGNAPYKKLKNGNKINSFDKVVRFNSFSTEGHEDFIGNKVSDWVVSDSYCTLEKKHFLKTFKKYPEVNLNIILPKVFSSNVEKLKRALPDYVLSKANILVQGEDIIVDGKYNFGRRWPSTGILGIYYYLSKYDKIYITGFNHFDPNEKTIHYYETRKQIGHQHDLEKQIVEDLIEKGRVIRL